MDANQNVSRTLRVCHLAYTFYENDNRVMRYAEALQERGHDVSVIALRRPKQPRGGDFRNVRVFRIQRRSVTERHPWVYFAKVVWFFTQSAVLLAALSVRRRFDIVHVHNVPDFLVFAAFVPKLIGSRVILDIHDALPELYAGKFGVEKRSRMVRSMLLVERLSCRFAHHIIVANDIWREKLIHRAVPADRCTTILNYPDVRLFRPLAHDGKDRRFIVLFPGSLNRHQGLAVVLKAFQLFSNRVSQAELHIYGEGPALQELMDLSKHLGTSGRVKFMHPVPIDQIPEVMATAAVGVEPKPADGFSDEALSTKIFEFMACHVPVIVSRTTVHQRYFNDQVVRFFPSGNAEALADALLERHVSWLRHDEPQDDAYTYALNHSWQRRERDYFAVINGLLSQNYLQNENVPIAPASLPSRHRH